MKGLWEPEDTCNELGKVLIGNFKDSFSDFLQSLIPRFFHVFFQFFLVTISVSNKFFPYRSIFLLQSLKTTK